jgi:hypothetical protein
VDDNAPGLGQALERARIAQRHVEVLARARGHLATSNDDSGQDSEMGAYCHSQLGGVVGHDPEVVARKASLSGRYVAEPLLQLLFVRLQPVAVCGVG